MPRKGKGSKYRRSRTVAERAVIAEGRRSPMTWDEINSTKAGGRDLGRY
jgi:hypothetical protein